MRQGYVDIGDPWYPDLLKSISDPPSRLFYKGNWDPAIFDRCLAVVGSRRMTRYGRTITERLVSEAAAAGITIVSGFMYGIDAQAHRVAIEAGGRTIAVMPCGIDRIHPAYQKDLYESIIASGGLIVSEYEGDAHSTTWMFPRRNRIVAGLSRAVMVVEAAVKSGSLVTARLACRYGRQLLAVPGPLTSDTSLGTAHLLKTGARVVTGADDVLGCYGICQDAHRKTQNSRLDKNEKLIMDELEKEPQEIDMLARAMGLSVAVTGTVLSMMQLKGYVEEDNGKYYCVV
jgi:DNA processing protein